MATLRDIKKRIGSVKNTQKITKAMKMVAAAKLRRAQGAVMGSRPYANKLREIVLDISGKSVGKQAHPIFVQRASVNKIGAVVFTSNRGLCGGFNSNLLKKADPFVRELRFRELSINVDVVGRKGVEYFKVRNLPLAKARPEWAEEFSFEQAVQYTQEKVQQFINGEIDEFYLIYNKFNSAISQEPVIEKLLPLSLETKEEPYGVDYIYEPKKEILLESLLPKFLATQVYRAHLESRASELGARMTAMDNASNNAKDMIGSLTLQYNRLRQAAITTELMDIVNGAEAIK